MKRQDELRLRALKRDQYSKVVNRVYKPPAAEVTAKVEAELLREEREK